MSSTEIILDPEHLASTSRRLCETFAIPFLHPFQIQTGQNILQKHSTILDVPTGSGKTLAFFYALFYHWWPGNTERDSCQKKIIVIISPLVALMQAQIYSQGRTLIGDDAGGADCPRRLGVDGNAWVLGPAVSVSESELASLSMKNVVLEDVSKAFESFKSTSPETKLTRDWSESRLVI
ncbi:uncharacterized protein LACBIDRAFT_331551 [Laccaria bicolor S238N-H82]|uniref:Predicted protein n=1 Tax=Laccaria bicolor (strain S238N-H82 / ATCC MYA-4686) TaxID=486041 RepID=B0DPT8_LACBS|nr:uncharacterized protein LACBIDRAFT_331551 [Laccaria bicolor S238N-H82]EDR03512.1 predicted protein [Laccaria bicolor S238N-H82]|eukprot:XP_001885968.1 predicted protein [Laccaria bicolor S238N-H82]